MPPFDINKELGIDKINPEDITVTYTSDGKLPEEFKNAKLEIDESLTIPPHHAKKTHTEDRRNFYMGSVLKKSFRKLKKYREYKLKL